MPITSGVRVIRAYIRVDGTQVIVEDLTVSLPAERKSATWSATVAVSALPAALNEDYWASQAPTSVDCCVMVDGSETVLLSGVVDSIEVPLGETKISIKGRCKSAMLHQTHSREKWNNKKPEEIITDLASRVGLSADIDSFGYKAGRFAQIDWAELAHGHSYAEVIQKYADLIGARWWVDGSTLRIHAAADPTTYSVDYQRGTPNTSTAVSISVTRNFQAAKPANVTTQGWDSKLKKVIKSTSTVSGVGQAVQYTHERHNISAEHAKAHAKGKAKEHARNEFSVSVQVAGDVSVNRATTLVLTGNAWAQSFEIDSVTHHISMGGGFTTDISAKGAKTGRSPS